MALSPLDPVFVPDAYTGRGSVTLPYAEGWHAQAGANPYASPGGLFGLPTLPDLPSLPDIFGSIPKMSDFAGGENNPITDAISGAVGDAAWWLGGRVVIVFLGLVLIVAGLYLFGTSDVASALRDSVKKGVA